MAEVKKYSEEELVLLLQQKDQQAFSYLYDNYSAALNGVIWRLVEDRELAEDILQEAFVRIWNNFSSYDSAKGRLFTWMLNLAAILGYIWWAFRSVEHAYRYGTAAIIAQYSD